MPTHPPVGLKPSATPTKAACAACFRNVTPHPALRRYLTAERASPILWFAFRAVNVIHALWSPAMLTPRQRVLLLTPLVLVLLPFLVWPALFGFVASFTNYAPLQTKLRFVGLHNYAAVLRDQQFTRSVGNILWMTLVAVPAELAVGLAIAYA